MTLKAIADELNTTTVTIYRRLEREGLKIKDLRDPDTKELTPQGAATIAALYKNTGTTPDEQAIKQIITGVMTGDGTGDTDEQTGQDGPQVAQVAQVAALTATVDGLRALVSQLEGERDELRRQLAQVTAALQAEQADRQQERLLLTGTTSATNSDGQQRRGWFRRLFNK